MTKSSFPVSILIKSTDSTLSGSEIGGGNQSEGGIIDQYRSFELIAVTPGTAAYRPSKIFSPDQLR